MRLFLITALVCASSACASETEETVRKSVSASNATLLKLDADFGSISVRSASAPTVSVEVDFQGYPPDRAEFNRMLHDFRLDVAQHGSEIRVEGIFVHGWEPAISFIIDNLFSGGNSICRRWQCLSYSRWLRSMDYRITVPKQFSADVTTAGGPITVSDLKGEVTAHTSGGPLRFDRIDGPVNGSTSGGGITLNSTKGRVVAHTSGGPIRMTDITGDVDASTSGGGISIEGASGRVKAHTSGGPIDAIDIGGPIDASTSGGGVTASLSAQPKGECRFYSSGGPIVVKIPSGSRVNLDASSSGGGVSTDFPVEYHSDHRNELRTALNGGGPLLYVHTSGGGIRILQTGSL